MKNPCLGLSSTKGLDGEYTRQCLRRYSEWCPLAGVFQKLDAVAFTGSGGTCGSFDGSKRILGSSRPLIMMSMSGRN